MDGDGSLSCEEFVTMSVHLKKIGNDESLSQAFSYFDKNQSGFIEFDELREALLEDNLVPNNEQIIHDILFDVDLDKVILLKCVSLLIFILHHHLGRVFCFDIISETVFIVFRITSESKSKHLLNHHLHC